MWRHPAWEDGKGCIGGYWPYLPCRCIFGEYRSSNEQELQAYAHQLQFRGFHVALRSDLWCF